MSSPEDEQTVLFVIEDWREGRLAMTYRRLHFIDEHQLVLQLCDMVRSLLRLFFFWVFFKGMQEMGCTTLETALVR